MLVIIVLLVVFEIFQVFDIFDVVFIDKLDVLALVLLAILLAAGFILNMTVGNALAATGIKPQFIIAAYALAIALTQASFAQAAIFGILSAAVIQITTSIPGLNFVTELAGALTMAALVKSNIGGNKVSPFIAGLLTTLVSGALFAVLGTVIMGAALPTALAKVPIVLVSRADSAYSKLASIAAGSVLAERMNLA